MPSPVVVGTRQLLEASFDGAFMTDEAGRLIDVNDRGCELLGYGHDDLLSRTVSDLVPAEDLVLPPASLEVLRAGGVVQCRRRLRHADGHLLECGMRLLRMPPDGNLLAIAREIASDDGAGSARREGEHHSLLEALQQSERRLARVFDATSDLLALVRVEEPERYYFEAASGAYLELAKALFGDGPTIGEERGELLRRLFGAHAVVDRELPMYREAVATGRMVRYELEAPGPSGPVHLDVCIAPVPDSAGSVSHLLWSARDITARKRAEDRVRASLSEKEVLLREIHHRVKNNLQIIASLIHFQSKKLPGQEAVFAELRARLQPLRMVHELLFQSPDVARVDLGAYLRDLVKELQRAPGLDLQSRIEVLTRASMDLPIELALPCGMIVTELVTNIGKYAFPARRAGSGSVTVERRGDRVVIEVSDDGVGFPEGFDLAQGRGFGYELVGALAAQLAGSLSTWNADGAHVELSFPAPTKAAP